MRIRAAVLESVGEPFRVQEVELQAPQTGEVLIRVQAVGVCHSDWHLVTGDTKHPLPLVAGHEGAGVVAEVGPGVTRVRPGDLVALSWAPSCGGCFYCLHGRPSLCETYVGPVWAGTMLDGTTRLSRKGEPLFHYSALACFAEFCVVPEVCCVPMPEGTPPAIAAVIGCAVMTGVGSVLNTAKAPPGSSALVIGAGGVGLATILGAKLAGASRIAAIDPAEARREAAVDVGADETYGVHETGVTHQSFDYVFECVGKPELQELAVELVRPGGTAVLSGLSPVGSSTNLPGAALVRQEKTVMGSYYGTGHPARDFPRYVELWRQGRLPLQKLLGKEYALDAINEAYADLVEGKGRRGIVVLG
jgi:S-(hydroxymethyl)glutathione dehydrogenase / alcohol dehydrogenase